MRPRQFHNAFKGQHQRGPAERLQE
jgi:hypothetical protein